MSSFVLTLIGNANTAPLEPIHIERACHGLALDCNPDWLAKDEACELRFSSSFSAGDLSERARDALSGTMIDAVCTPIKGRRKKLLISDMDSTVINQECIDELGDAVGCGSQIKEITRAVVRGDIRFSDALRQRLALMKGMKLDLLEQIYEDRITLQAGARTLVQTMRHHGAYCILVSGGFSYFTRRIAARLGFHDHQGNALAFEGGKLTGEVLEPILGRSAKQETLVRLCDEHNLLPGDALAVGDGANDIKMIEMAGLGVAFHGVKALKSKANACVDHGDLTALLYIQGYRKPQFVMS